MFNLQSTLVSVPRISRSVSNWAQHALYIDRGLLVLNKPPGVVCQFHRDGETEGRNDDFTGLVQGMKDRFDLKDDLYPVHRLDKGTTGALALALSSGHARTLAQQFESRTVDKTYLALVRGGAASFPESKGTVRSGLTFVDGRVWLGPGTLTDKKAKVVRRIAETDWEVLASSPIAPLTLVKLHPETGLKHQLRVHMAHNLKAPILGDMLYSRSALSPKITQKVDISPGFMFLHSSQLSFFRYRQSGAHKQVRVTVGASLPPYFVQLCTKMKIPLQSDVIHGGLWIDGQRVWPPKKQAVSQLETVATEGTEKIFSDDPRSKLEGVGGRWVGGGLRHSPSPMSDA